MNVLPVLDVFHGKITDLIAPDDELCFLVGAGISMDPPSSLPSAREIVKTLVQACVPADDVERILSLHTLRYELLVEGLEKIIDTDLKFLDYLDIIKEPNAIHQFLAFSIDHGHHVFTTNFDALIEIALIDTLPPERRHGVAVVITRDDYLRCVHPNEGMKSGTRLLFKLHGAKRNHVTGQNTKDSLITTTSALGKNKEGGTSFAIEAFKKPAINCAVQGRILVVMGYSGHDDFDIGPALLELQGVKRVIWIDHVPAMASKIDMYRVRDGIEPRACEGIDHVDQVLEPLKFYIRLPIRVLRVHLQDRAEGIVHDLVHRVLLPGPVLHVEMVVGC